MIFYYVVYFLFLLLMGIKQRDSRAAISTVQTIPENTEILPLSIIPITAKKLIAQIRPLIALIAKMIFLKALESTSSSRKEKNLKMLCLRVLAIYALLMASESLAMNLFVFVLVKYAFIKISFSVLELKP